MDLQVQNIDYWRNPVGVEVSGDRLKFLYVTDEAEHRMVSWLAKRVFEYQVRNLPQNQHMTKMVMITMGALLPGVLLQDYLAHCSPAEMPKIEFGTFGVRFYQGPGQPLKQPEIVQPLSIDVCGQKVGIIEDLIDLGGTARFVDNILRSDEYGARQTVIIAPYHKSAPMEDMETITFGAVPRDTWIITPRERVETMVKRVPYWVSQGMTREQCIENLRRIGYADYLLDEWFDAAWERV